MKHMLCMMCLRQAAVHDAVLRSSPGFNRLHRIPHFVVWRIVHRRDFPKQRALCACLLELIQAARLLLNSCSIACAQLLWAAWQVRAQPRFVAAFLLHVAACSKVSRATHTRRLPGSAHGCRWLRQPVSSVQACIQTRRQQGTSPHIHAFDNFLRLPLETMRWEHCQAKFPPAYVTESRIRNTALCDSRLGS